MCSPHVSLKVDLWIYGWGFRPTVKLPIHFNFERWQICRTCLSLSGDVEVSCTTSYFHLKVISCLEALSCGVTFHFNDTVAFHSRFFLSSSKFCARRQWSQSTLWWLGTASANRAWLNPCVTRRSAKQVPGGLFLSKLCVWNKKVAPEQYDTCMDACKGNGPNKRRPSYAQRVQQVCSDGLDMCLQEITNRTHWTDL